MISKPVGGNLILQVANELRISGLGGRLKLVWGGLLIGSWPNKSDHATPRVRKAQETGLPAIIEFFGPFVSITRYISADQK